MKSVSKILLAILLMACWAHSQENQKQDTITFAFEVVNVNSQGIFGRVRKTLNWSNSKTDFPEDGQIVFITNFPREVAEGDVAAGKMIREGFAETDDRKWRRYRCVEEFTNRRYF